VFEAMPNKLGIQDGELRSGAVALRDVSANEELHSRTFQGPIVGNSSCLLFYRAAWDASGCGPDNACSVEDGSESAIARRFILICTKLCRHALSSL
jgi:hypothetical protein